MLTPPATQISLTFQAFDPEKEAAVTALDLTSISQPDAATEALPLDDKALDAVWQVPTVL